MPYTVVIADDVTGANDIGIMYAKAGLDTVVYSSERLEEKESFQDTVTIIDTNSRFLSYSEAYERVYRETKRFCKDQVHQFFDKQCSVFRGNIGAEFDAMLDALDEEFAVVVAGFPDNGRQTIRSIHYVHGTELKDSQFRNDPVHPMTESNLAEILKKQTKRRVGAVWYPIIDQGSEAVKKELDRLRGEVNYVIMDVRDNRDLEVIARAVKDEKIICGSSAIGYYLGKLKKETQKAGDRIFCIAGSLTPQTLAQTAWMRKKGYPVFELDTMKLFTAKERKEEKERILRECKKAFETDAFVMVHSMQEPEKVARTKELAAEAGIGNTGVSGLVSGTLAQLCEEVGRECRPAGFIICGGDTSGSFCERLKIKGMRIEKEIQPGLPTCRSITPPYYKLVLKSGSFGNDEFIEEAYRILRTEE